MIWSLPGISANSIFLCNFAFMAKIEILQTEYTLNIFFPPRKREMFLYGIFFVVRLSGQPESRKEGGQCKVQRGSKHHIEIHRTIEMLLLYDVCLSSASESTMERGHSKVQRGSKQTFLLSRNNHFDSSWDDMTELNFMKHRVH